MCSSDLQAIQYKNDMRVLAVASEERFPLLPDIPTFKEQDMTWLKALTEAWPCLPKPQRKS